jgi:hypothetical protein
MMIFLQIHIFPLPLIFREFYRDIVKKKCFWEGSKKCIYFSFLDCVDRLSMLNYLPTNEDILRARLKTTGIIETNFDYNKINIT